jgi:hypothetical protein
MPKADNRLSGARSLNILGAATVSQTDKFKPKDTETLYRFSLVGSSRFDATLSSLAKKSNADVELYRFKNSAEQVLGAMGGADFSLVPSAVRETNLQRLATSKRRGNRNEKLAIASLETGEYVVRVFRKTGRSQYSLKMAATAIAPPLPESRGVKPTADLSAANLDVSGSSTYGFTVTYSDDRAIDVKSLDDNDIQVTGPNGFSQLAKFVSVNDASDGTPRTATYGITAPGGAWDGVDAGNYNVALRENQVSDTDGSFVNAATIGSFLVNIPRRSLQASGGSNGSVSDYSLTINTAVKPQGNLFSQAVENFRFVDLLSFTTGIGTSVAKNINLGSANITSSPFTIGGESGVSYAADFADYSGNLLDGRAFTLSSNRLSFRIITSEPNAVNSLLPLESFLNNFAIGGAVPSPDFALVSTARDANGNDLNASLQISSQNFLFVN